MWKPHLPRWRLEGALERRVLEAGLAELRNRLSPAPARASSAAPVAAGALQAALLGQLLSGKAELKACSQRDLCEAQLDLQQLTLEQLLILHKRTVAAAATCPAVGEFHDATQSNLFEKLARWSLSDADLAPRRQEPLRALGMRIALHLGAAEMLRAGEGREVLATSGADVPHAIVGEVERPKKPAVWALRLGGRGWTGCGAALLIEETMTICIPMSRAELKTGAAEAWVTVVVDQSEGQGNERVLNWDIVSLDPNAHDILHEMTGADRYGQQKKVLAMDPQEPSSQAKALHLNDLPSPLRALSTRSTSAGSITCTLSGASLGNCSTDAISKIDSEMHEDIPLDSDDSDGDDGNGDKEDTKDELLGCGSHLVEPSKVVPYLSQYGFVAQDVATWRADLPLPKLHLRIMAHEEANGHTYYMLICEVRAPESAGASEHSWATKKRLQELRANIHDVVKEEIGAQAYKRHFAAAPFARRGGLRGTSSRLNTWLRALTGCVAESLVKPQRLAEILAVLEAPQISEHIPRVMFH